MAPIRPCGGTRLGPAPPVRGRAARAYGIAVAGIFGEAEAGLGGTLVIARPGRGHNPASFLTAIVGEAGIKPNCLYEVNWNGNFIQTRTETYYP